MGLLEQERVRPTGTADTATGDSDTQWRSAGLCVHETEEKRVRAQKDLMRKTKSLWTPDDHTPMYLLYPVLIPVDPLLL